MGINKVEIRLEIHNMCMQRSCNYLLNPRSPFLFIVWTIVISLDISRSADINANSTVNAEGVVKNIVVVSNCCNHADHKSVAFGDLLVCSVCVPGDGMSEILSSISTEYARNCEIWEGVLRVLEFKKPSRYFGSLVQ